MCNCPLLEVTQVRWWWSSSSDSKAYKTKIFLGKRCRDRTQWNLYTHLERPENFLQYAQVYHREKNKDISQLHGIYAFLWDRKWIHGTREKVIHQLSEGPEQSIDQTLHHADEGNWGKVACLVTEILNTSITNSWVLDYYWWQYTSFTQENFKLCLGNTKKEGSISKKRDGRRLNSLKSEKFQQREKRTAKGSPERRKGLLKLHVTQKG